MRTFSAFVLAILRAGALACVVLLFSGLGLAQKVVSARATIPFEFWAEGHQFQAGDYVFDNEVPGLASIHCEGTNSGIGVPIILYAVPQPKENPRVIFALRDGKYLLFELWIQDRYVVTAEFEHRGEASEQQRPVPLTVVESRRMMFQNRRSAVSREARSSSSNEGVPRIGERNEYARGRAESARLNPRKV